MGKKSIQNILEEPGELLDTIFSSVHDSIAVSDLKGKLIKVNSGTLKLHGYRDEKELLGKNALDLIHPSQHERALRNMSYTLEEGMIKDEEFLLVRRDGSTFFGELTANVIPDHSGKAAGFVAVVKDISERKKRENDIRWLYDAVRTALVGMVAMDRDGVIIFANQSFAKMWQCIPEEAVGESISHFLGDEGRGILIDMKRMSFENRIEELHMELTTREKGGSLLHIMTCIAPFANDEGEIRGYLGSFVDITGRKRLEKELGEKVRDLEAFGNIVAHDLKTSLITIKEFSRLLAEDISGKITDEEGDLLNRVVSCSAEALSMVEDLRKYLVIDSEKNHFERVHIGEILDQVQEALLAGTPSSEVTLDIPRDLPSLVVRPSAFFHVFYNLTENAVKFGARTVRISYQKLPNAHRFSVIDDGWGIEPYFAHKIFNIFSRSPRAKKEKEGTGIGLAIVKRLIEKHNGKIWMESKEGQGSTFSFEIPDEPHLVERNRDAHA